MKKLSFLFLLITNYCYAQYIPFNLQRSDNAAILQQSFEQMERRQNEANVQYSKLQMMLAEYGSQLKNDEATLIWFDQYKRNIASSFSSLSSLGWGDARDYAIRKQGEIANDPELMARIRTAKEYNAAVKNIQERKDMSQEDKQEWQLNHPYCFIPIMNSDDKIIGGKLGTKAELGAFYAEVERKAKLAEEQEKARLYAMSHPFDDFDYSRYDKVIDFPQYKYYSSYYRYSTYQQEVTITRVALSSTETRIEMEWYNSSYDWCNVERGTYIKASGTDKLSFIKADNIAISPSRSTFKKSGEILKFALIFPPLPKKAKTFTLAEPDKRGWKCKDIKIQ